MRTARAALALALALLVPVTGWAQEVCRLDRVDIRSDGGVATFTVAIADEPRERAQGLMFVESMPMFEGMLFVYESPRPVSFWMRNTLIPLDMIFMDITGTVQRVHENAIPLDETSIPGGDDIFAVLEINGGLSAMLGIKEGAVLRHPLLPQETAAWPCAG
ncbi:MAG: DUF192 domain-containing protein [Rubricella sp.]